MTKKEAGIKKYWRVHHWLRYHYGSANKCLNPNCPKKSSNYQWSLKKGKVYEKNINNFTQLCISCHKLYDVTEGFKNKMRMLNKGKKLTVDHKKKISKSLIGHEVTKETRKKISLSQKKRIQVLSLLKGDV